jgi:RNA polymerase sigma factor (sigma-70 family)
MSRPAAGTVLQVIRRLIEDPGTSGHSDAELLRRFTSDRDEAAFRCLMHRHGPMVLNVCREVLGNEADAADAFQATFLILAQKSGAIRKKASVGSWLYGVAYRTARKARKDSARRHKHETRRPGPVARPEGDDLSWREIQQVIHDELNKVSEPYLAPLVLCYLQGKTQDEAAMLLGVSKATLKNRLERGRALLRARLVRRGLGPLAALLASAWPAATASASLPATLASNTVKAATLLAAGKKATGLISAEVGALTEGVLKMMFLSRLKTLALLPLALALLGLTIAMGGYATQAADQTTPTLKVGTNSDAPKEKQPPGKDTPGAKTPAQLRVEALLQDARKAAEGIEDKQWKAWMLQSVAEEQANVGDKAAAAQTFQAAVQAAKEVPSDNLFDPTHRSRHTLLYLSGVQASVGDVKGARQTAELAIKAGEERKRATEEIAAGEARYFLGVATAQAREGKLKEAAQTVDKIEDEDVRILALAMLARAQFRAKDKQAAGKTFERSLKIAAGREPIWSREYGYMQITRAQAEIGDLKAARKTADAITSEPWKSGALLALQISAGDFKGAVKTALAIEEEYRSGEALNEIAVAQLRSGDLKGGLQTATAIKSGYWRVRALADTAKAQAESGDQAAAAQTFKKAFAEGLKVQDKAPGMAGLRNAAHCHIVQALAEVGQDKEAVAWAMKQTPRLKAMSLLSIAKGIASRQEREKRP